MVKQAGVAAWLIGIAAVIAITAWSGLDAVGHAVASVGWGILFVVVVRGVTVAVAGAGWWLIFPPKTRPRLRTCVLSAIRSRGDQCPAAHGASRRRCHRRGLC